MSRRILFATIGSLGDLHPFIAVAKALEAQGAQASLAVPADQVEKVRGAGLEAAAIFPSYAELEAKGFVRPGDARRMTRDPHYLFSRVLFPNLGGAVAALDEAAQGAELIVGPVHSMVGAIVAEKRRLPFIPCLLQPMALLSALDPPVMPELPLLAPAPAGALATTSNRMQMGIARLELRRRYAGAVNAVRRQHGLPPDALTPMFGVPEEAPLVLALYSRHLAPAPADAPPGLLVTGFPVFDSEGAPAPLEEDLAAFLREGEAPIVFTLGSFAVYAPGDFYEESRKAAEALGRRALLLAGPEAEPESSPQLMVRRYAPHSQVFPHAAAIVHHGGVGTTGQAMAAGRPQLVVPHSGDQWDNAARIARLGLGLSLPAGRYAAGRAQAALGRLLKETRFAQRGQEARVVAEERGAETAATAILRAFG
jgi:rhamnosyltransferase subunit B